MNAIFHYRTVVTPVVMPPKPFKALPRPAMSLAEDAARCNARMRRSISNSSSQTGFGQKGNAVRMQAARERDDAMIKVILALLQTGPMSRNEIVTATHLSDDVAKRVLHRMRDEGLVKSKGHHRFKWERAE